MCRVKAPAEPPTGVVYFSKFETDHFSMFVHTAGAEERERLSAALRQYCELDTWGVVRLLDRLRQLVGAP